ncbi:MAG: hypothetical protein M3P08_09320 [Thermoproteota archaeon]|nr:hypothetical protein [Thermoproteota archaeon]
MRIITNLGTEAITYTGAIDGYISVIGFNPTKQLGLVILCSCDEKDITSPEIWQKFLDLPLLFLLHPESGIHQE